MLYAFRGMPFSEFKYLHGFHALQHQHVLGMQVGQGPGNVRDVAFDKFLGHRKQWVHIWLGLDAEGSHTSNRGSGGGSGGGGGGLHGSELESVTRTSQFSHPSVVGHR
jgi:hypothetical protein